MKKELGDKEGQGLDTVMLLCPPSVVRADLTEHSCAQEHSRMLKVVLCVHLLEETEVQRHGAW